MTVDEYFKDLETTLTKTNIHDREESKIAMFVSGLRRDIQNIVELYEYSSLKKLVHLAIKVKSQILKKQLSKIHIMMTSTNIYGRIQIKLLQKLFLLIFQKKPLLTI